MKKAAGILVGLVALAAIAIGGAVAARRRKALDVLDLGLDDDEVR